MKKAAPAEGIAPGTQFLKVQELLFSFASGHTAEKEISLRLSFASFEPQKLLLR